MRVSVPIDVIIYVMKGASSLRKWRHSPRIDHDVLCGKSLRWEIQTVLSGVCVVCDV